MPEKNPVAAAPQPAKGVSFGERMRRERELRGVKLEEIAESTKIGKRNLVALEEEAFDQLPGGIFNKGFVRAYAKFLGLDEEQAVNDFLAAYASTDQPTLQLQSALLKPAVMPSDEAVRKKDLRWAVAALVVLIAALAIWLYVTRPGAHKPRADSAPQAVTVPEPKAAEPKPQAPPPASNHAAAAPAQLAVQEASPQSAPLVLSVHATADSWISVIGDGAPLGEFQMHSGESHRFQAEKSLTLKAGNAGAIDLSLNGKRQPKLGKDQEVKSATFSADTR